MSALLASAQATPVTLPDLSPQNVAGLIGVLIPIAVSALSRSGASAAVKVWVNIVLTAMLGAVAALVVVDPTTGTAQFGWVPFLLSWLYAFIASTIAYVGALQHFDVNDLLLALPGIFGQKTIPGVTVDSAGAIVTTTDGTEVAVQDDEATSVEQFPQPELLPSDLEAPVAGTDS